MRIGLVIYGDLYQQTGGYLYDRKEVEYLQAQGDQVEIFSLPWRSYIRHLTDNLSPDVYRTLGRQKLDILIEDELNHPSLAIVNHILSRRTSFPIISIVHHLRCNEANGSLIKWFYQIIERIFLSTLAGLICNSQATLRSVQALTMKEKLPAVIAYPGKDHLAGDINEIEIERRARQSADLHLLFLGNLIPRKGLHWLLAALSQLRDVPLRLDIVGDESRQPAYGQRLRRWVTQNALTERVQFWGAVDENTLQQLLRRAHILVLTSSYEGFGIAYLDGMRYGLVVIGSSQGGASELISEGVEGFLIEPGDVSVLRNHLLALHKDRARLAQMGMAARKRFDEHPTWAESAAKIRNFLVRLVQEGRDLG